jgi:hypothetical protein
MKARRIGTTTEFDVEGIIMNGIGYVMEDVEVLPTVTELSTEPDKELLDALKKICKVAPSYIKNPDDELDNAICEAMLAVYDYEQKLH